MSNFWRAIFEPKKELTIDETRDLAAKAAYPFFLHGQKIYSVQPEGYTETPTRPEMLDEPVVFAVMDKDERQLLMLQGEVPFLFISIPLAQEVAKKANGVVKPLGEALYLNREAAKNQSPIIVPPGAGEIVAARG